MGTRYNPYSRNMVRDNGSAPGVVRTNGGNPRYAVPDIPTTTDPEYQDGFSPLLKASPDGATLPDDIRIGLREPPPNDPNRQGYSHQRDRERRTRIAEAHESSTVGWNVKQSKVAAPVVPEWTQEREPIRPTAVRSPLGYSHTRDWHIPRHINDVLGEQADTHTSMADHRRDYPIYGMAPRGGIGRNTFRLQAKPWDDGLVNVSSDMGADHQVIAPTGSGNRSFRLRGN